MIFKNKLDKKEVEEEDQLRSLLCFLSRKFKSITEKLAEFKSMLIRIVGQIISLMIILIFLSEI